MPLIKLHITLEEAALFTGLQGEPNSVVSYDYIPGSVLRGMVIGLAQKAGHVINLADDNINRWFFSSANQFLNAYIVNSETHTPSLPVPLSWRRKKYPNSQTEADIIYDDAISPISEQTKTVRGFVTINGQNAQLITIERTLNVHTERPRRGGGEGTVYRYDAVASGQTFIGHIRCDQFADAELLSNLLAKTPTMMIGGARSAGYGCGRIDQVDISIDESTVLIKQGEAIILTLMSDTIVSDAHGVVQPTMDALLYALNQQGGTLTIDNIDTNALFLDTTMVGGFNRKWGLPLQQTPALMMGSVIVFCTDTQISLDILTQWERYGIGLRTEDGFGRVAVNWQREPQYIIQKITSPTEDISEVILQGDALQLWQRISEHKAAIAGGNELQIVFQDPQYAITGNIPRTQLARLRQEIAIELRKSTPEMTVISKFLMDIKGKYADKQYQAARIDKLTLKEWLSNQSASEKGSPEEIKLALKIIDAVLERKQKESKS